MTPRNRKLLEWLLGSLVGLAVLIAVLGIAFGVVVSRVPEYRVQVQDWLRERSGLVVEFSALRARWRLYGPELVFDDAIVRTPDRTQVLATARQGSVGFDIWRALREGRLRAGRFVLASPQIGVIRTKDGRIQLLGQSGLPDNDQPFSIDQLPTGRFDVNNAVVTFRDEITGRGPWSVSGVSFELTRAARLLELRGEASLPQTLGRQLTFAATVEGALEEYGALDTRFRIAGENLDLAGWADVLPDEWPAPETGQGAVRIAGALHGARIDQLTANVDLRNVSAQTPEWSIALPGADPLAQPGAVAATEDASAADEETTEVWPDEGVDAPDFITYERLAFALDAKRQDDSWEAHLRGVDLARADVRWQAKDIRARWARSGQDAWRLEGGADHIELGSVWPLLAFAPESERLARVRAFAARGAVTGLEVRAERSAATALTYSLRATVKQLAFAPVGRTPGFAGLSGAIEATEQGGEWRLSQQDVRFELPRWFREPLAATLQGGRIQWRREGAGWRIESDEIAVRNADGRATARFAALLPGDGSSTVLDITAHGEDINVAGAAKYIPAGRLGARTMEWFDQAFLGGRITRAEFVYRGPTLSFPFRRNEGEFVARAHVEDGALSYQQGWAPATAISADLEFRNAGMRIDASSAVIAGLQITAARASIPDLKQTQLTVTASATGDVHSGLEFLKTSPLAPALGEQFARLDGSGPLRTDVHLYLPIKQMTRRDIRVTARLANASATYVGIEAPFRNISGVLTVRNTLLSEGELHGRWLGAPVQATITPEGRGASLITVEGESPAPQLAAMLHAPAFIGVSGALNWRASTRWEAARAQGAPRVFQVQSDTRGLGVQLPAPLGKAAPESRDLRVNLQFNPDETLLVRGAFGDVRTLINVKRRDSRWSLDRGAIRADAAPAALPDHSGLRIEGAIDRFVLDDWLALANRNAEGVRTNAEAEGAKLSAFLRAANVRVREFEFLGYRWDDLRGVLQADRAGWRIDLSGEGAQGQLIVPEQLTGEMPLRAALERLVLKRAPNRTKASPADEITDPRKLPALQVHIGDLRVGSRTIGMVDLRATRATQGLSVDNATIATPVVRAEARGHWFMTADGPQSALKASVLSSDVAATLAALNYSGFLEGEQGEIRADLTWPGGFNDNILRHASGGLSVRVDSGQIVSLQPGAGRMLGLFSIAALPRRLALDFSDLTEKGLAFDSIAGDFELRDGQAYTTNLLLRGPAAEIGIAGRTGFNSQDYDQTAVVTGNLGASLPIAGALAGGPAVGAAVLLFSQVFKEPLKGITRGYYRITGPWENPTVERIDAAEAAATETGARLDTREPASR